MIIDEETDIQGLTASMETDIDGLFETASKLIRKDNIDDVTFNLCVNIIQITIEHLEQIRLQRRARDELQN